MGVCQDIASGPELLQVDEESVFDMFRNGPLQHSSTISDYACFEKQARTGHCFWMSLPHHGFSFP